MHHYISVMCMHIHIHVNMLACAKKYLGRYKIQKARLGGRSFSTLFVYNMHFVVK